MGKLSGKKILIGITGGISAYKICELIRMFKREGAVVNVVVTPNALHFVTKLTLQTLSQNNVYVSEFEISDFKPEHIALSDDADVMVIAPATANTISKLACGICDNLLTSIACAFKKPIFLAPAMNNNMWDNPIIQTNIANLAQNGYWILPPENGFLACGSEGTGRLCSLDKIFDAVCACLISTKIEDEKKKLTNKKILITSGGTIEEIDPVRYISNYSSGKMGYALARVAYMHGAEVTLVTTNNVDDKRFKIIKVKSARDMQNAVMKEIENQNVIFMASAVADYRVKEAAKQKIKKTSDNAEITLTLVKNPDILKKICDYKHETNLDCTIVGFCAESENLLNNAREKIAKKGCDYLIANDISRSDIGFGSDYNEVSILSKEGIIKKVNRDKKENIAEEILKFVI